MPRVGLVALAIACLVVGVGAGLARAGVYPFVTPRLAALHGPLMVSAFFGAVVSLERAVALGKSWAFIGPIAACAGGAAAIVGAPIAVARVLFIVASAALLAASAVTFEKQRALFTFTLALGPLAWLVGNSLWLASAMIDTIIPWWMAFLVLTIAGERLELSRLRRPSRAATIAFAVVLVLVAIGLFSPRVLGVALVALTVWLVRNDIVTRTIRQRGLTRFIAVALLLGYAWLFVGGVLLAWSGLVPGSPAYDAAIHAVMLGFVFSMVLGHAPIIIPAVAGASVPFHRAFYAPLALLHASVAVRLLGDATMRYDVRSVGAALNATALAAFILFIGTSIARAKRAKR